MLWQLHRQGFDVSFKGGTSLSKGFGVIQRFSEDLDLKTGPGSVAAASSQQQELAAKQTAQILELLGGWAS